MKGRVAVLLAAVLLVGTSWSGRAAGYRANVDPALHDGDVALVQVQRGTAWTVASELVRSGATDVVTLDAIDVVTARVNAGSITAIAGDRSVRAVTNDTAVAASAGPKDRRGHDLDETGNGVEKDSPGAMAIGAPRAWARSTGAGIVVALIDSGIADHPDLAGKVVTRVDFVNDNATLLDPAGHGTHLAGVIAGNGRDLKGVAPDAKLVSLRVLDTSGAGLMSNVLKAFDWLLKNRKTYDVRVANISFGAPEARSYHDDLLSAVAESAWFAGITVVAAAGNDGPGTRTLTTPGSDPFVVTVGSFDDQGTVAAVDDRESDFSSRGPSIDLFAKPDVLAPGRRVVSLGAPGSQLELTRPDRTVKNEKHESLVRMTGTSVSAAMVSGVAALVLAAHPSYTPTKVKGAIVASGRAVEGSTTRAVDAANALVAMTDVNVKVVPSRLLVQRLTQLGISLGASGVSWEGVSWESVSWESVSWEGVSWESVIWETVSWE